MNVHIFLSFPLSVTRLLPNLTISNTAVVFIRSRNCLPFASTFSSPLFLCCSYNLYLSSFCVLCPMLHVSYSLFIAHSVFANVCVVSQFEWSSIDLRDIDGLLCNWSNTTSVTSGTGTVYPSRST